MGVSLCGISRRSDKGLNVVGLCGAGSLSAAKTTQLMFKIPVSEHNVSLNLNLNGQKVCNGLNITHVIKF